MQKQKTWRDFSAPVTPFMPLGRRSEVCNAEFKCGGVQERLLQNAEFFASGREALMRALSVCKAFERTKRGCVVNFSSMTAQSAVTRVFGYSNAKAGIDNLTKWLAVEFAKKIGEGVRVNAVAPGFFISSQNRTLLTNPDGSLTERGKDIVKKTPFGRFGDCDEVFGTVHYLCSDAAKFVTGTVIAIDGGFSAFSGV